MTPCAQDVTTSYGSNLMSSHSGAMTVDNTHPPWYTIANPVITAAVNGVIKAKPLTTINNLN